MSLPIEYYETHFKENEEDWSSKPGKMPLADQVKQEEFISNLPDSFYELMEEDNYAII